MNVKISKMMSPEKRKKAYGDYLKERANKYGKYLGMTFEQYLKQKYPNQR